MKDFSKIIDERRGRIMVLVALFALWVFSQYIFKYSHGTLFGLPLAWEYATGFARYMIAPWLVTMLLVLCGYVVGKTALGRLMRRFTFHNDLEESMFAVGIGLGVISLLTFAIGLAGLLYPLLFGILALAVLVLGRRHLIHLYRLVRDGFRDPGWDLLDKSLIVLILVFLAESFLHTGNPSTAWDAMNSHLVAPKFYLREHAISFYPWIKFNSFPQLQEMLLTLEMMLLRDPGSSLIYAFMVGSAILTYLMGGRYFNRRTGLIAAVIFLAIRHVYRMGQWGYVEHLLIFYGMLMMLSFLAWYESRDRRLLVLLGISAGLACGIKYLGITITVITLLLILIAHIFPMPRWELDLIKENAGGDADSEVPTHGKLLEIARSLGIVLLWTIILGFPWYLRNIVLFGNPFFPFFENLFGGLGLGTLNSMRSQLAVDHSRMLSYFGFDLNLQNLIAIPWTATFRNDHATLVNCPSGIGPMLLAFTPAALFVRRWRRAGIMLIVFTVLFYFYWFILERVEYHRYLMSAFPFQAIIAAWGLSDLFRMEAFNPRNRAHLAWLMLAMSLGLMFFIKSTVRGATDGRTLVFANEDARRAYLASTFDGWELIEAINNDIATDGRSFNKDTIIYGLATENRRFYIDCPSIGDLFTYANHFDFMAHARTGEELYNWLRSYGCEYLLYSERSASSMSYVLEIDLPTDETFDLYFERYASYDRCHIYRLAGPGTERAGPMAGGPDEVDRRLVLPSHEEPEGRVTPEKREIEVPL